jgi:CheY-like chemotaxis protein
MTKCLEEENYTVSSASNGVDALTLIKDELFDVIFMDISLPGMSNIQLLKWMEKNLIYTPIAVVTEFGTLNDALEYLDNGVIAYIKKPLTSARFKKYIAEINKNLSTQQKNQLLTASEDGSDEIKSHFAPAEKLTDEMIYSQAEMLINNKTLSELFDIIPNTVLVLNKERQIIYSNSYFLELIGVSPEASIGLRPGEVLSCIHAYEDTKGCGTTECCSFCGAVQAIIQAQTTKQQVQRECLMNYNNGEIILSRELFISVTPADHIQDGATIFIAKDISNDKMRMNMERIFFHDLLNTSGSIKNLAECAKKADEVEEIVKYVYYIYDSTDYLIDEINAHKLLMAAERNELSLNYSEFSLIEMVQSITRYFDDYKCEFKLEYQGNTRIVSDKILVYRVVMNMIKNAAEADKKVIRIQISQAKDFVDISVHNQGFINKEAQLQMFKKFFSTKGKGRGIGTYSMKLLGEGLLKGKVWFESSPDTGTEFTLRIPNVTKYITV